MHLRIGLAWWALLLGLLFYSYVHAQQCSQGQLNTEFLTDPTARNYLSCASDGNLTGLNVDDQCVLNHFNEPCTNNAACKVDQSVTRETIWEAIDPTELETLMRSTQANDVARKSTLDVTMLNATFDMSKSTVRQKFNNIFTGPNAPLTNAAIAALQQKNVPRSQSVCHRSGTLGDISCGLRGDGCL